MQVMSNMSRLPFDIQAKIEQKFKNGNDPEQQKENQFRNKVKQFMASTEMNAKALEDIKA